MKQMDGELAYRKPNDTTWYPLSEQCCQVLITAKYEAVNKEITEPAQAIFERGKFEEAELKSSWADIKVNKQKMEDVLHKSVQAPNLAFFAGSGTSLSAGAPSMWDLWKRAVYVNPDAKEGEVDYKNIKPDASSALNKVKYKDDVNSNIEHFLSQCDAYLLFNDDDEVERFVIDVKEMILEQCSNFIKSDYSNIKSYVLLMNKLAKRRTRDPRLKIFTTNYDMCFESAASSLGIVIIDGFSYTRKRRFDGKFFNFDLVRRSTDANEYVEGIAQLYKLHGSVSWEREGSDIFEKEKPSPTHAALIYPAKGKYQQAFIQPHLELLSRFLEQMRQPNCCLIVSGFGFNDDHLSEPIYSAIKSNPSMKLIISDYSAYNHIENPAFKNSSPYWSKFAELSESGHDITFINASFDEVAKLMPNMIALSPAERLLSAVKSVSQGV